MANSDDNPKIVTEMFIQTNKYMHAHGAFDLLNTLSG